MTKLSVYDASDNGVQWLEGFKVLFSRQTDTIYALNIKIDYDVNKGYLTINNGMSGHHCSNYTCDIFFHAEVWHLMYFNYLCIKWKKKKHFQINLQQSRKPRIPVSCYENK